MKFFILLAVLFTAPAAVFGATLFVNCDNSLREVCLGDEKQIDCIASGTTIAWFVNDLSYCNVALGVFDEVGVKRQSTGSCSVEAELINKEPNISRLHFTVTEDLKNLSCFRLECLSCIHTCTIKLKDTPSQPQNLSFSSVQPYVIVWDPSPLADRYIVQVTGSQKQQESFTVKTTHTELDLSADDRYTVSVRAVNCNGASNFSDPLVISTEKMTMPENIGITLKSNNTAMLHWNYSENHCYEVRVGDKVDPCVINGSYRITDLQPNQYYDIQVAPQSSCSSSTKACLVYSPHLKPDIQYSLINNRTKLLIQVRKKSVCDIISHCACPLATAIVVHLNNTESRYGANVTSISIDVTDYEQENIIGSVSVINDCGISPAATIELTMPSLSSTSVPAASSGLTRAYNALLLLTMLLIILFK